MAEINFNANDKIDNDLIPPGCYECVVTRSELKYSKSGGNYLNLEIRIISGPEKNRMLWQMITRENANEKSVKIGQRQLQQLCHAVGVLTPRDSVELHNLPFLADIIIDDKNPDFVQNRVKKFMARENVSAPAQEREEAPFWTNEGDES